MNIIRKIRYRYIAFVMIVSTLLFFCLGLLYITTPRHVDVDIAAICLLYPEGDGCTTCLYVGEAPGNLCERCETIAEKFDEEIPLPAECINEELEWPEYQGPIVATKWYDEVSPVLLIIFGVGICMNALLSLIVIIKFIDNQKVNKVN